MLCTSKIALMATFIWIGMVAGISFLEAWLKFRAPGITLALGLGIGRLVFAALNKVEWVLATLVAVHLLSHREWAKPANGAFYLVLLILVAQTLWLFPILNDRAAAHISGVPPPPSSIHIVFVAMEVVKTVCLFAFGLSLFDKLTNAIKQHKS